MEEISKYTMDFEPSTIDDLGVKLYVTLPPVIGELISNSYDADSPSVEVILPDGPIDKSSVIMVKDKGNGMDSNELQNAYLKIGRKRREVTGQEFSPKGRPLMGRKGLGKLSAFGIADEIEIYTVKNNKSICIRLNYEDMKNWPSGSSYEPKIVYERTHETVDPDGTEIIIKSIRRKRAIDRGSVRKEIARRFSIFDDNFIVLVNCSQITPEDRRLKKDCKKVWDVSITSEFPYGNIVDKDEGWIVTGWIGLVERSSQIERGVDIFARGKSVELETMFGFKSTHTQFARAYIVGEINAEFVDAKEDQISTGRNSVQWESEPGQKLQEWGQKALKYIFEQWRLLQVKQKEEKIIKGSDFDIWLKTRSTHEQSIAKKLFNVIIADQDIEPESAKPLLEIIKSNVEYQAFQELVSEIEESGANVQTLLRLFDDWELVEAREHLKLADGRLEVMDKLSNFIKTGALEVQEIQPIFEKNGWLVDPSWGNVTGQTRYTDLLRKNCKEPKDLDQKDRRIDILGYRTSSAIQVVELKRPEKTLSWDDLVQIERYVYWARANLMSTGPDSPRYINGILIVGRLSTDHAVQNKMTALQGVDIRVETFGDLVEKTKNIYGEVENRLKVKAPEYSREARRARKKLNP